MFESHLGEQGGGAGVDLLDGIEAAFLNGSATHFLDSSTRGMVKAKRASLFFFSMPGWKISKSSFFLGSVTFLSSSSTSNSLANQIDKGRGTLFGMLNDYHKF